MPASYTVQFVRSARKEFEQLPEKVRTRAVEALNLLAQNPYSELLRVKKLKGSADLYRIRLSDYRIVYELRDEYLLVVIVKVGHRRDIYSK